MTEQNDFQARSINYAQFELCSDEYQGYVKRILAIQAFAERCGACEMGSQLHLAPNAKAREQFAQIVYEEANHAHLLYAILERIGVPEKEAIELAQSKNSRGTATQSLEGVMSVGDQSNTWLDIVLNNMFLDRAGGHMVANFANSSFTPWADACVKIYNDEKGHKAFGYQQLKAYIEHHGISEDLIAKTQKWYVYALNFFGPPNVKSTNALKAYGIKQLSNEELRQEFMADVIPALNKLGLSMVLDQALSDQYPYEPLIAA